MADTQLQQLIVWVGTTEKIEQARAQGLITENDFAITTDAPEFQTKLTSANAGTGISITEVGGVVKISNTQTSAEWGNIQGSIQTQTDLWNYLSQIGVLSSLSTTVKTDLVSAINEVYGVANTALQPSDVVNAVNSTATNKPLSANMGKELQDQVDNLKARGRFLALWNCATGLAQSNPPESPYTYKSGDYFIVGTVASGSGTNYKPSGATYTTGVASTTVETAEVSVDDVYYYDGTNWRLQVNTQKTVSFQNIAGDPYDNTNLASALNDKVSGVMLNGTDVPADSNHVVNLQNVCTTNTAQDVTATKTFKAQQKFQYGGGDSCLIIGADVTSNTVTANTRKLGRMAFHTNESTTLNCAFVSTDTQDAGSASVIKNCVDFGGRPGDTLSTSPDVINFTVATVHNTTTQTEKKIGLSITKDGADFAVQPKYNDNALVDVATTQTISGTKTFTGSPVFQANNYETLIIRRNSQSAGALITYSNNSGVLARMGINGLEVPIHIPSSGSPIRVLVRGGSQDSPTVGGLTQPVYIDSDGITQVCTGVQEKSTIQTLSTTDSITLTDNYLYNGNTQTALTIALPATDTVGFICEVDFSSGSTATTLSYSLPDIFWEGVDVAYDSTAQKNIFTPVANKRYTIIFYYDGVNYNGRVGGV